MTMAKKKISTSDSSGKQKPEKEIELNFSMLKNFRINYPFILLMMFVFFGFFMRFYHLQYPVIGYHNWKVTHYITEARNFARGGFFKYGFFVPMQDTMETTQEQSDGAHGDTFPTISIIVGFLFKIFGESLTIARLVGILFSVFSIIPFYLLIKELFGREDFALVSAFLASINPLYVFFSHNVQLDNPALFFMLTGGYIFILWLKNKKHFLLPISSFFVMLGTLTKYTFAVIGIPIFFSLLFWAKSNIKKKEILFDKKLIIPLFLSILIFIALPAWYFYAEHIKNTVYGQGLSEEQLSTLTYFNVIDFKVLFDPSFWQTMKSYVDDNFTLIGILFSFIGLILFLLLFFTKNFNKVSYWFVFGYIVALLFFVPIMGFKLSGHSYHQFPIAPIIIFLISYFIVVLSSNLSNFIGNNSVRPIIKLILIIFLLFIFPFPGKGLYSKSMESKDRMFNTQFPGLDVAGDYIKQHSSPNERFFHSSGQSFGVLWHADRKGYKPPRDVEYLKKAEEEYNVTYIFAYQWGIQRYFQDASLMEYIRNNYRLVQIGFVPVDQQVQPIFFLFRKGGTFNETQFNMMIQGKPVYAMNYNYIQSDQIIPLKFSVTPYEIRYINLE